MLLLLLRLRRGEQALLVVLGEAAGDAAALQLAHELREVLLEVFRALHAAALEQLAVEQRPGLLHDRVAQVALGSSDLQRLRLRDELVQLAVLAARSPLQLRVAGKGLAEDGVEQLLGALGRGDEVLPELVGHAEAGGLDVADALEPHAVLERVDQVLLEVVEGGQLPARCLLGTPRTALLALWRRAARLSWRLYLRF